MIWDPRRLRALSEVGHHGSFSRAAEALGVSQSAVSQHVAALEREAGAQLVDRSNRRAVRLTPAGETVVRHAERILAAVDDAEADLRRLVAGGVPRLRLGSFSSACATFLPEVLAAVPAGVVDVDVVRAEPLDALARVAGGELDAAVIIAPVDVPPAAVELVRLWDERLLVALPGDDHRAGARSVVLADLAGERWIQCDETMCPDTRQLRRLLAQAGVTGTITSAGTDYLAVQGLVGSGAGIALWPEGLRPYQRTDVALVPLRERPVRTVALALPVARVPGTEALLAALRTSRPRQGS